MKTPAVAAALAAVTLAVVPARAREIDVAAGVARLASRSASFDAVSEDDAWNLGAVEVAAEAARLPFVDLLHAELSYTSGSSSALDFDQFRAMLQLYTIHLGARATHLLTSRVRTFVHAELGLTIGVLTLDDYARATPIRDSAVDLSAFAGGGVEVAVFRFPRLDVGVRAELGYFLSGALAFAAEPDHPDDDVARLPTFAAELGSIDPSGAMGRFVVVGRF